MQYLDDFYEINGQEVRSYIPVGVTDSALTEALAGRFETATWADMGQFLGKAFLRMTSGRKENLEHWLNKGLPGIQEEMRKVLADYYQKVHT